MSGLVPGLGMVKGMALTLPGSSQPKATVMYPEMPAGRRPRFRGRLQLLYDEYGALKCETCFQCAQACPIECIDMGGMDTKGRFHVHWGPPETYGERREESALRRSGRTVPDQAYEHFAPFDLATVDEILERTTTTRSRCSRSSRRRRRPSATCRSRRSSGSANRTGAWYAMIYGTATYYRHLRFEPPDGDEVCRCTSCLMRRRRILDELGRRSASTRRPATATAVSARHIRRRGPRRARRRAAGWPTAPADGEDLAGMPARRRDELGQPEPSILLGADGPVDAADRAGRPATASSGRRAGAFEGLRRAIRELGPAGHDRRGRGERACAAAAAPATRPPQVAGRGRDRRRGAGTSSRTATARIPATHRPRAHRDATRTRSSRASRSRRSRSAPTEAVHRRPRRGHRGDPAARGGRSSAAEDAGFIGDDVLGAGRTIEVTVRPVQGAYMLGEETVLLKALEGKRGQPEQRPPHPARRAAFPQRPTVVQNVQTLAAVPWILRNGAEAFAAIGSADAPGTILVDVRGLERRGRRRGPDRHAAPRHRGPRRQRRPGPQLKAVARRRPDGRHPARRAARHAVRRSTPSGPPAPMSAPARSSSPTTRACVVDLARAADPVLRRRGVRQDDPLPDRPAPDRGDRRAARRPAVARPATCSSSPTCRPTSSAPRCATTSAWRPSR